MHHSEVIHHAIFGAWSNVVAILVDNPDLDIDREHHGMTLLTLAAGRSCTPFGLRSGPEGALAAALTLLQMGADPNRRDCFASPLLYAASSGDVQCVKLLLQWGANPGECTEDGLTPVAWCLKRTECALPRVEELVALLAPWATWPWAQEARVAASMGRVDVADLIWMTMRPSALRQAWMCTCARGDDKRGKIYAHVSFKG